MDLSRSVLPNEQQEQRPPNEEFTPPPPRSRRRWLWLGLLVLLIIGGGIFLARRGKGSSSAAAQKGRSAPPAPVVAAAAHSGDIGVYYTGLGAVTPIYTVTVKSRVDGQLLRVAFKEGQTVHQGELLVQIDPRPYEVQLKQAEGQLAKDQAALDNARIDLARYQTLLGQNAIAEQQLATQKALIDQDVGAVKIDQGQIDAAKLNIAYCRITAPITGRAGLRLVDPGNIVHASDANGLLVITQVEPVSVIFTISEDQLPAVLKKVRAGQHPVVTAFNRDMKNKISDGTLTTLDNQIDQTTGTVKLRATFSNKDESLFPNQFVNARLTVDEKHSVTLVPSAAIQRGPQQTYVYVVKGQTVTLRNVTVGTVEGDESEITSGLVPGDIVVTTGVDKLQEGSKVNAQFANGQQVNPQAANSNGEGAQNPNAPARGGGGRKARP